MPKPFDATLKELIRSHPVDWLSHLGIPVTEQPEVLSVDLSTVTAAADTLLRVGGRVIHIDVESGPDESLARRMLYYNVLAHHHTGLPVESVAVLLRSNAQRANYSDRYEYKGLSFQFRMVKIWELSSDELLEVGVGLLPLAVLGRPPAGLTREQALRGQVERIASRIQAGPIAEAGRVWTAAYVLAGMHVAPAVARAVFKRVEAMHESGTYQLILEEGAIGHTREVLLKQGRIRWGEPTARQAARLKAIEDLERLDRMVEKILSASGWDALLRTR